MAKRNKNLKSKMTPFQLKKVLKTQTRECQVSLNRLKLSNVDFREALFRKYDIRNCNVCLPRLTEEDIEKAIKEKKRLTKPKQGSVRSNVSWIPTAQKNFVEALSTLDAYRELNGILPRVEKKKSIPKSKVEPAKRQRAKSMFVDQSDQPIEQTTERSIEKTTEQSIKTPKNVRFTLDDMHLEFSKKYASWNHGLNPINNRQLVEPQPKSVSHWKKLFDEFQAKREAKQVKNT